MAHTLEATDKTVHWGVFDGALDPVIRINSGETVTVGTVSGIPSDYPPQDSGSLVRPELKDIHASVPQGEGPHILTGPIGVEGARPGDLLKIDILDVRLADNWGYNVTREGRGALPELFSDETTYFAIDTESGRITTPWNLSLEARPFFGILGTAPARDLGPLTSIIPGAFGGNMDNKELVAGSTLYLPVFVDEALFSVGDGHAVQGDGEVCLTAVETGLQGTFRIEVLEGQATSMPFAETPDSLITMAFDEDLDIAMAHALRDMIARIGATTGLSAEACYRLCSLAADLRITQVVNVKKGVHILFPRALLGE